MVHGARFLEEVLDPGELHARILGEHDAVQLG